MAGATEREGLRREGEGARLATPLGVEPAKCQARIGGGVSADSSAEAEPGAKGGGAEAEAGHSHAARVRAGPEKEDACNGALACGLDSKNLGTKSGSENSFAEHRGKRSWFAG